MKKILSTALILLLFLSACSRGVPKIEQHSWTMTSVQDGATGRPVAYGTLTDSISDAAKKIDLTCTAQNGVLTLADNTNGKTYTGSYKLIGTDPKSANYEITLDGKKGIAVSAMTTFMDGTSTPTFIINFGPDDYTVNFSAE